MGDEKVKKLPRMTQNGKKLCSSLYCKLYSSNEVSNNHGICWYTVVNSTSQKDIFKLFLNFDYKLVLGIEGLKINPNDIPFHQWYIPNRTSNNHDI